MSKLLAEDLVRDVPDFPKPGILFKDITPVVQNYEAREYQPNLIEETQAIDCHGRRIYQGSFQILRSSLNDRAAVAAQRVVYTGTKEN